MAACAAACAAAAAAACGVAAGGIPAAAAAWGRRLHFNKLVKSLIKKCSPMPRWGQDKVGDFGMARSKVRLPEVFAAVLLMTHGTTESSQLGIVLGQVDDDI